MALPSRCPKNSLSQSYTPDPPVLQGPYPTRVDTPLLLAPENLARTPCFISKQIHAEIL